MKNKNRHVQSLKLFGLSILAGYCLCVPFLHYNLGWLVLVSLVPFLYLLHFMTKFEIAKRSQVAYIWLSGWIMLLGVAFWMIQTQPERWASLAGWWAIAGLLLSYLIFSLVLSLGFVIFGCLYVWSRTRLTQKRVFLLLPAIWVLAEWLRSWLFSIVVYGPNTSLGSHWNFGHLGFALSVTPLVYAGRFVGLYGLSFMVVAINLAVFWLLQRRWKLPLVVVVFLVLLASVAGLLYARPAGKEVHVGTLQLGENETLKIGSINYHDKFKSLVGPNKIDVLVLPEYSEIFNESTRQTDMESTNALSTNNDTPVITSRQRVEDTKTYNTVTVYRPDSTIAYQHDKQFLIPVGEAMPYIYLYLFNALGQKQATNNTGREITKGTEPGRAYHLDGIWLGSMACSGAISPELYRGLVTDGAQLLTNSASLSIFSKAPTYHQQAQQMARFMAVANARPFVQATDGSFSFVLDANGAWITKSSQFGLELLQTSVVTNETKTIYSILGEWVVWFSLGIVALQTIVLVSAGRHSSYKKKHK